MNGIDKAKMDNLMSQIVQFNQTYQNRDKDNFRGNAVILVIGLLCSLGVAATGMLDQGKIAALLGLITAFLFGLQNAFPMGEKAEFYRLLVVEGENLKNKLEFSTNTDTEFQALLEQFGKLKEIGAKALPRGKGMEAIRDMSKELGH